MFDRFGHFAYRIVAQTPAQLPRSFSDGVPARQPMTNRNLATQPKILWSQYLVGTGVSQNRLGMDSCFVDKRTRPRNIVIERNIEVAHLRDHLVNLREQL